MIKAIGGTIQPNLKYESRAISNSQLVRDVSVLPDRFLLERVSLSYIKSFREYFAYKAVYKEGDLDIKLHYNS